MSIDNDIVYDKFELNNNTIKTSNVNDLKEQSQFYSHPNNISKETGKMNYQNIYQDLNNASEEFDIVDYKSIASFLKK